MTERQRDMVERYGEACTQMKAAEIINRSRETIRRMLLEGRIKTACEGTMVDVRSLAEYIERPRQIDQDSRLAKKRRKENVATSYRV